MDKLIIFGSSWSAGEWAIDDSIGTELKLIHPGMSEYLSDTFKVVNFSKGSSSLWKIIYSIHNYCEMSYVDIENTVNPAKIIVFQNDPFMSALSEKFNVDYQRIFSECTDLKNLYQTLTEIFYIKLSELQQKYKIDIYLCGGASDIDINLLALYPNLKLLCESWIKLLDDSHIPSVIPLQWSRDSLPITRKYGRLDLCEQIIDASDNNFASLQKLLESKYIGPVFGDYHPNRLGHEVMANYIKNFFKKTQL